MTAGDKLTLRMLHIAVPLALSAYARSTLTTLQHLLVPRGLKAAGFSADRALSGYGTIQGMVLPVIFFPPASWRPRSSSYRSSQPPRCAATARHPSHGGGASAPERSVFPCGGRFLFVVPTLWAW